MTRSFCTYSFAGIFPCRDSGQSWESKWACIPERRADHPRTLPVKVVWRRVGSPVIRMLLTGDSVRNSSKQGCRAERRLFVSSKVHRYIYCSAIWVALGKRFARCGALRHSSRRCYRSPSGIELNDVFVARRCIYRGFVPCVGTVRGNILRCRRPAAAISADRF